MFNSIVEMAQSSVSRYSHKDVFRYKVNGVYQGMSYREFGEHLKYVGSGLCDLGLNPGDRIAILGDSCYQWAITDLAIQGVQGVVVPIYPTLTHKQISYMLNDAGVRGIFVDSIEQYQKIEEIRKEVPTLEWIFAFNQWDSPKNILTYEEIVKKGKCFIEEKPTAFQDLVDTIDKNALCSIVYTSGTTGMPKGVMLSHHGFVLNVIHSEFVLKLRSDDVFLSFLPLSHLYERLGGNWVPIFKGCTIGYAESIRSVMEDIQVIKPTLMTSVPRLYQKIEQGVLEKVNRGSFAKRKVFAWAINIGLKYAELKQQGRVTRYVEQKYQLANKLVFSKIKEKMGGRLRCPISGGAPISTETLKLFDAMGLNIIEGYGMTETHLIITLTSLDESRYGSCGKPIPGVSLKIAEDGELLIKSEMVMLGYYNNPDATSEVIDPEGWLHTGDIGHIDQEGYLWLTDRKKNIIITSGGKNIAPAPIENAIRTSIYIEEICLIGEHRKFISALIVPNYDVLKGWGEKKGLDTSNLSRFLKSSEVIALYQEEVDRTQVDFARVEQVKKFVVLNDPFSIETGELTPSLKIKRNVIQQHYINEIDTLYL